LGLNKTSGNMYPWVTHTWNPLSGKCKHDCEYCYMKDSFLGELEKYKGDAEVVQKELNTDLGAGRTIFVGSATDLFGEWVSEKEIKKILSYCKEFDNTYLFQSKNPARIADFEYYLPENCIVGVTLETNRAEYDVSDAPSPLRRYQGFFSINHPRKMVSIEPIMDFDIDPFVKMIEDIDPEFVSVGADSKTNGLEEPSSEKIEDLVLRLNESTEIMLKKNLKRLLNNYSELKRKVEN